MATERRAVLTVLDGPNAGDTLNIEYGVCRLIGRHLSEAETSMLERDGTRSLDQQSTDILSEHLKEFSPDPSDVPTFESVAYERGSDIVLADDSISRAHAMIFFGEDGLGVIDLASTNGTFINSEAIGSGVLRAGDLIKVGQSLIEAKIC